MTENRLKIMQITTANNFYLVDRADFLEKNRTLQVLRVARGHPRSDFHRGGAIGCPLIPCVVWCKKIVGA